MTTDSRPRPTMAKPSTRSTNLCQSGEHERCPLGGRPSGWRGPFRCWCLCHNANDGQRGGLPA